MVAAASAAVPRLVVELVAVRVLFAAAGAVVLRRAPAADQGAQVGDRHGNDGHTRFRRGPDDDRGTVDWAARVSREGLKDRMGEEG